MNTVRSKCSAFIYSEEEDADGVYLSSMAGETNVSSIFLQNVPYRWLDADTDNEQFQIFYGGKWYDAQSIDFNFD